MDVTILWFKRDLRVADHPALALAAGQGAVVPVYIVEPGLWAQPDMAARHWRFTAEALAGLDRELQALGVPLQVVTGDAVAVLSQLCASHGARRIVSHEETGNAWTYARDRAVGDWAGANGIDWVELPQSGVIRRLKTRDAWQKRRDGFMRLPQLSPPAALTPLAGLTPCAIPEARDLGLSFDPCPGRQKGGRAQALSLLGSFLSERGQDYRSAMSSPLTGEAACSRLSPHFALGTMTIREAVQATAARRAELSETPEPGWAGSLSSFSARLAWRDHFIQKLEDAPDMETRPLHSAYEGLRPVPPDAARLAAWEKGETGIPFIDACMRALIQTGWINFRMRAMLVSFATHHLWLDWRPVGHHLARLFTDYEPGIHWPQVQMQAGVTGMNTIRIYNPVKQGAEQDPQGIFTRRWLPELAELPDGYLQEPWLWPGAGRLLGKRYPVPVVDPARAARAAREALYAVRRSDRFRAEAAQIVTRHASRKPARRRGGARTTGPSTQLSLDL